MRRVLSIIFVIGIAIFLSACGNTNEFKPADYISTTGSAQPDEETRIELEDGAAIVVPAGSVSEETEIVLERNPEKINDLPPLGDDVVQLGDFYNFEFSGDDLTEGVDLIFPLDENQIPEGEGIISVAIPTEDGWEYFPAEANGNEVVFHTINVGDPLTVWHFVKIDDWVDLSSEKEGVTVCDPYIPLSLSSSSGTVGTEIKIKDI